MRFITAVSFFAFFCQSLFAQLSFGEPHKLNNNWRFILNDEAQYKSSHFDDSDWQIVNLPHDWSVKSPLDKNLASATGYLPGGIAWYRKTIDISKQNHGKKIYLYFEGVYNRSEVYVNGEKVGNRPNGYISFAYDITAHIIYGEKNNISVRVDHSKSADSRWYTGSGIYRNVWMIYSNPVHIAQWGVFAYPEYKNDRWTLNIDVDLKNETNNNVELEVVNSLFDNSGQLIVKEANNINLNAQLSRKFNSTLNVRQPHLWSVDHPQLYKLKTEVFQNGELIDQTTTQTAFRNFTFNPNKGFAINSKWTKLKGVCLHHDSGVLGAAFYPDVWASRISKLKEIGVNAIRTSHNPQAPEFYQLCDSLGMLVLNEAYDEWEFPKRKWLDGWNVGTPGFQGSFDIFEQWAEIDLEDFVRRDRNHPSVFAWSIGNEVDYPNDPYSHPVLDGGKDSGFTQPIFGGYQKDAPPAIRLGNIAKRLVSAVKIHDQTRPTTAGLAGVAMSNATDYPFVLDITGYNYTENKYHSDHQKYPNRVIYGSENRHEYEPWLAVKNNEFIFGQFLWTGIDYLGESREWPSRGFYSGLIDFIGNLKPRGYFRQSLWSKKPMVYIGTYPTNNKPLSIDAWDNWDYKEDQQIRVVCYTNMPMARLELNGKVVGKSKPYDNKTGIISWDIPYKSGKLVAVGLSEDKNEVCRFNIKTSSQPTELHVANDKPILIEKNNGVAQITLHILDSEGDVVTKAKNKITCHVEGAAVLLGLDAANNSDMSDYSDNAHNAYRGKISAFIKATGENEPIKVTFSSPGIGKKEVFVDFK